MKKLLYSLGLLLGIGLVIFYFFQERFIFLPGKKLPMDTVYNFSEPFEEVFIETSNGATLNALHFTHNNPKGIILFFHGNKGNLERWGNLVPYLLDYHYEVLVVDYRSYGKSTGKFNEALMYEDAISVYNFVKEKYDENQIVVYGRSLGATFAARVGAHFKPKHIVLEAPFYSMKKAVQFNFVASPTFLLQYHFKSYEDVPKISSPFTIFHGTNDETTSFDDSKELFKLASSSSKQFIALDGATHHDVATFQQYKTALRKILN